MHVVLCIVVRADSAESLQSGGCLTAAKGLGLVGLRPVLARRINSFVCRGSLKDGRALTRNDEREAAGTSRNVKPDELAYCIVVYHRYTYV